MITTHRRVGLFLLAAVTVISFWWLPAPPQRDKQVIEVKMIPVENSMGEYILEYSNGHRELLQKDGKRVPLND